MIEGIKNLLGSEKALVCGSLAIAATVLVVTGHMTVADWQTYTRDVLIAYISGKTLQGAMSTWAGTKKPEPVLVAVEVEKKPAAVSGEIEAKPEEKKS